MVVVEDLHEVIEAGPVLTDGKRNVYGAAERDEEIGKSGGERILDPRQVEVVPLRCYAIAEWRSRHDQCRSTISWVSSPQARRAACSRAVSAGEPWAATLIARYPAAT